MATSKVDRLRAICAQDPSNTFAWYTIAMELKKTDVPAAIAAFEDVHQRFPQYVANYYQYAKTLEDAGNLTKAKATYEEGMRTAKAANDSHAYGELQAALEMLA